MTPPTLPPGRKPTDTVRLDYVLRLINSVPGMESEKKLTRAGVDAAMLGILQGGDAVAEAGVVSGLASDASDSTRLDWTIRRSAQLFRRETPEPLVMLAYFPLGQDGFMAGELEERPIAVQTVGVRLSSYGGDENRAIRALIDAAMGGYDHAAPQAGEMS